MLEMTPKEYRSMCRSGEWTGSNHNICRGYAITDVVILPKEYAYDFLEFCHRNPRTCPLVDMTEIGSPHPLRVAPDADLRTDLSRYRVYKSGEVIDEPIDIKKYWSDDLVAFLLGVAGSFDWALKDANVHYRSLGVYTVNIPLIPVGPFHGNIIASCRLFTTTHDAVRTIQITSRLPLFHGVPIHIGDPSVIGIKDLSQPYHIEHGENMPPRPSEVALFWPTGATLRNVVIEAKLPITIVDYPLHNFITDKLVEELAVL